MMIACGATCGLPARARVSVCRRPAGTSRPSGSARSLARCCRLTRWSWPSSPTSSSLPAACSRWAGSIESWPTARRVAKPSAWAHRLAGMAPRSLRHFKELIQLGTWVAPDAALARGHEQAAELMGMADTAEGGRAFAERRPPRFEDR